MIIPKKNGKLREKIFRNNFSDDFFKREYLILNKTTRQIAEENGFTRVYAIWKK